MTPDDMAYVARVRTQYKYLIYGMLYMALLLAATVAAVRGHSIVAAISGFLAGVLGQRALQVQPR